MATTTKVYRKFFQLAFTGELVDLTNYPVKVMLLSSSYSPNIEQHTWQSDVASYEISGTGYTAGGNVVDNVQVTYNGTNTTLEVHGDDVVWTDVQITFRYAVVYLKKSDTQSSNPLIGMIDFGSNKTIDGMDFALKWDPYMLGVEYVDIEA